MRSASCSASVTGSTVCPAGQVCECDEHGPCGEAEGEADEWATSGRCATGECHEHEHHQKQADGNEQLRPGIRSRLSRDPPCTDWPRKAVKASPTPAPTTADTVAFQMSESPTPSRRRWSGRVDIATSEPVDTLRTVLGREGSVGRPARLAHRNRVLVVEDAVEVLAAHLDRVQPFVGCPEDEADDSPVLALGLVSQALDHTTT